MGAQGEIGRVDVIENRVGLFGFGIADVGAMLRVDVPVEFEQCVFREQLRTTRNIVRTDVEIVATGRNRLRAGDGGVCNTDVRPSVTDGAKGRHRAGAFLILVGREEKQFVLDDWAADGHADGFFLKFRRIKISVIGAVVALPNPLVVAEDVIHTPFQLIGSRFGDGVDVGTGVALLGDVVIGHVDLYGLNGIDRNGLL